MRQLISYDDIAGCPEAEQTQVVAPQDPSASLYSKYQKRKPKKTAHHRMHAPTVAVETMDYEDENLSEEMDEGSQELAHDDIWDDSALIEAWNAATEEYEAYHGPHKHWKTDPTHKSPLWYNPPNKKHKANPKNGEASKRTTPVDQISDDVTDDNHQPLNFDTFLPTHDPSLGYSVPNPLSVPGLGTSTLDLPGSTVSQDEAFSRALGAMYWVGYWTAVYHRRESITGLEGEVELAGSEQSKAVSNHEEDLVPTQR